MCNECFQLTVLLKQRLKAILGFYCCFIILSFAIAIFFLTAKVFMIVPIATEGEITFTKMVRQIMLSIEILLNFIFGISIFCAIYKGQNDRSSAEDQGENAIEMVKIKGEKK